MVISFPAGIHFQRVDTQPSGLYRYSLRLPNQPKHKSPPNGLTDFLRGFTSGKPLAPKEETSMILPSVIIPLYFVWCIKETSDTVNKVVLELAKRRQSQYAKQIEFCVADATNRESILELKRNRAFTKAVSNMAIMDITDIERPTQRGHGAGSTKEKYPLNTSQTKSTTL